MNRNFRGIALLCLVAIIAAYSPIASAVSKKVTTKGVTYTDSRGVKVFFPSGEKSFATEVVSFQKGSPSADVFFSDPSRALGPPNYIDESHDMKMPADVTMGCSGVLTLKYTNVALVDKPGADLYVFEVGPALEATSVDISEDGKYWIPVGSTQGGTSGLDIGKSPYVKPGQKFQYLRLHDLKTDCSGAWPGADIDAVGLVHLVPVSNYQPLVKKSFHKRGNALKS